MLHKILACLLLMLCGRMAAQPASPLLPGITLKDVQEKAHPQDSTAVAVYLYRSGRTWFDLMDNYWVMYTEVYSRIKIYKKEGYKYATPEIVFYSGEYKAKGFFSDAATYNEGAGKLEKTPMGKEGEFAEEYKEDYTHKKIALPNVHEGSIIEYKYTIRTPYFGMLRDFYFQFGIPANQVRYDLAIPNYFYYNVFTLGYVPIKAEGPVEKMNDRTEVKERTYSYTASSIKPIKDEPYVNNLDNYTGIIRHELAATAMPGKNPEMYATDWESVAKKIYDSEGFGRELRFGSYFEDDIAPLITAGTPSEKMLAVFTYVQKRMAYNGKESYLCKEGVKKAYAAKTGNVAEINLMLTAMMRHAGLDANPVLVSTRDNGIAVFPNRYAYNYVICAVKIDGKTLLLDASDSYTTPDFLPIRAINWEGRLIKKNGDNERIDLTPTQRSRETMNIMAELAANGSITGKVRDQYLDYNALVFRDNYAGVNKDSYLEKLEKQYPGYSISEYTVTNEKEADKPLTEQYSFTNTAAADVIGDKMYVTPMLFFALKANPFKQEKREFPVDFIYPSQDKYLVSIRIPDGYTVESVPKSFSIAMADNAGRFLFSSQVNNGNTLQFSVVKEINDAVFSSGFYTTLKDFYEKIVEKQSEKIVLKKS